MTDDTCSSVQSCDDACGGHSAGNSVNLRLHVRKDSEPSDDVAAVTLSVKTPNGTVEAPAVTHDDVGEFHSDYVPAQAGQHFYQFVTTGGLVLSIGGAFLVAAPLA